MREIKAMEIEDEKIFPEHEELVEEALGGIKKSKMKEVILAIVIGVFLLRQLTKSSDENFNIGIAMFIVMIGFIVFIYFKGRESVGVGLESIVKSKYGTAMNGVSIKKYGRYHRVVGIIYRVDVVFENKTVLKDIECTERVFIMAARKNNVLVVVTPNDEVYVIAVE